MFVELILLPQPFAIFNQARASRAGLENMASTSGKTSITEQVRSIAEDAIKNIRQLTRDHQRQLEQHKEASNQDRRIPSFARRSQLVALYQNYREGSQQFQEGEQPAEIVSVGGTGICLLFGGIIQPLRIESALLSVDRVHLIQLRRKL